jgi:hypothetical protein
MENELIIRTFRFKPFLLESDFSNWKTVHIPKNKEEIFVFLNELSLTNIDIEKFAFKYSSHIDSTSIENKLAVAQGRATEFSSWNAHSVYQSVCQKTKKEFLESGEIKGYEIFCVNANVKVWASRPDWDAMTEDNFVR